MERSCRGLLRVTTSDGANRSEMAKKSLVIKAKRPAKFSTRAYHRCRQCGRPRSYLRKFGVCRLCFRKLALEGRLPGVFKASW